MKTALICVVNPQDNDIILQNLIYYYNLGINNFYLMLHKSDRILRDKIFVFETSFDVSIQTFFNEKDEHWHDKDCKILTDACRSDGIEWIIGSDADELLILKNGISLETFLKQYNFPYGSLHFQWFEYKPLENIYDNAFINMKHRDKDPRQQTKSIGIFNSEMMYVPGLHYIANSPEVINVSPDIAFYAHFSDRNEDQYCSKMRLQAKNWNQRYGKYSHWAEKMIEDDPEELNRLWSLMLHQNRINKLLVYDPINPEIFK